MEFYQNTTLLKGWENKKIKEITTQYYFKVFNFEGDTQLRPYRLPSSITTSHLQSLSILFSLKPLHSFLPKSLCHPLPLFLSLQSFSCQACFLFPLYPKVHSTHTPSFKFSKHFCTHSKAAVPGVLTHLAFSPVILPTEGLLTLFPCFHWLLAPAATLPSVSCNCCPDCFFPHPLLSQKPVEVSKEVTLTSQMKQMRQ